MPSDVTRKIAAETLDEERRRQYDNMAGIENSKTGSKIPKPEKEDPLLKWLRSKYAKPAEPFVPPHVPAAYSDERRPAKNAAGKAEESSRGFHRGNHYVQAP